MNLKVLKFGGSSLADAEHYRNAAKIVKSDTSRRYVVVSAPGKRSQEDVKITDLLLQSLESSDPNSIIDTVADRFQKIILDLGLTLSIEEDVIQMKRASRAGFRDFLISRGEYLSGKIMAELLGYDFIDAKDGVRFCAPYLCDWENTRISMAKLLQKSHHAVIPGFYGSDYEGNIRTFLRGGSDITGAIVADAVGADLYENFTDVSGVLAVDPNIIPNPSPVQILTYDELRTFSHLGAEVLHEDAIRPCQRTNIPILIKNSNRPWDTGTYITSRHKEPVNPSPLAVGVKKGMSMISVRCKSDDADFQMQIVRLLRSEGISVEHVSEAADCITFVASSEEIKPHEQELTKRISALALTESIAVKHGLVLLGVIGKFPNRAPKIIQNVSETLNRADISIDLIEKGYENSCIIAMVKKRDRVKAVNTIYSAMIQGLPFSSGNFRDLSALPV